LTVLNGICGLIISHFDKPVWNRRLLLTGMVLTIAGAAVFMLTRQPESQGKKVPDLSCSGRET